MSIEKVINFPFSALSITDKLSNDQLELFDCQYRTLSAFTFANPDEMEQDSLIYALSRNRINSVLDLRLRPVFRRPRYDHKEIISYFQKKSIAYVEMTRVVRKVNGVFEELKHELEILNTSSISDGCGFTLCLADEQSRAAGIVQEFRRIFRDLEFGAIEVNPRSLLM